MFPHLRIKSKLIPKIFLVVLFFILYLLLMTQLFFSTDRQFVIFTKEVFNQELSGSTLNLHYTLADPQNYGISSDPVTLGKISIENIPSICKVYAQYEKQLLNFPTQELNKENQLTRDLLLLYFHTEQEIEDFAILQEPLSPSLGTQAQLPVLLAEYTFRTKQDIVDYLKLLTCIRSYFQSILSFEEEKAKQGVFMSDATVDRIIKQCNAFISNPEENYLIQIFEDKIQDFPDLTDKEKEACREKHKQILLQSVIPSYRMLVEGLLTLKGQGHNPNGLAWYPNGKEYYLYLLKTQVGTYDSPTRIEARLYQQFMTDYQEIKEILARKPELSSSAEPLLSAELSEPSGILNYLSEAIKQDFPKLPSIEYQTKYVHSSMEKFLSPAFYLTPPIDTGTPNTIYINRHSALEGLELYTTLAHEGFPGHLYQTQYFRLSDPLSIRQLITYSGYIEGWATYVESYIYTNAPIDPDYARLAWLNRSVNLCLYSLVDLGIHYHGWTYSMTEKYLQNFGITNKKVSKEMFQYIVETPANYLKYYWGYINFLDLYKSCSENSKNELSLKEFHKKVLNIGPVSFPILQKYLQSY